MCVTFLYTLGDTLVKNSIGMVLRPFIKFIVIAILIAVALAVLITVLIARSKREKIQKEAEGRIHDLNTQLQLGQASLTNLKTTTDEQLRLKDELMAQMTKNYDKNLEEIRTSHKEALKAQAESLKAELTAKTEELLKQRQLERAFACALGDETHDSLLRELEALEAKA